MYSTISFFKLAKKDRKELRIGRKEYQGTQDSCYRLVEGLQLYIRHVNHLRPQLSLENQNPDKNCRNKTFKEKHTIKCHRQHIMSLNEHLKPTVVERSWGKEPERLDAARRAARRFQYIYIYIYICIFSLYIPINSYKST